MSAFDSSGMGFPFAMLIIGLVLLIAQMAIVFGIAYWAARLAIRHERRRAN
jgi:hypothetical protein